MHCRTISALSKDSFVSYQNTVCFLEQDWTFGLIHMFDFSSRIVIVWIFIDSLSLKTSFFILQVETESGRLWALKQPSFDWVLHLLAKSLTSKQRLMASNCSLALARYVLPDFIIADDYCFCLHLALLRFISNPDKCSYYIQETWSLAWVLPGSVTIAL